MHHFAPSQEILTDEGGVTHAHEIVARGLVTELAGPGFDVSSSRSWISATERSA
jgi:hypothetical protein